MMDEKYMTRREVAEYLSVSVRTVDRMAKCGVLTRYDICGMPRFRSSDVQHVPSLSCSCPA